MLEKKEKPEKRRGKEGRYNIVPLLKDMRPHRSVEKVDGDLSQQTSYLFLYFVHGIRTYMMRVMLDGAKK